MSDVYTLVAQLRASRGYTHKRDIARVLGQLAPSVGVTAVPNGDDCAVLPEAGGGGHLLFAIEGLVQDFVEAMPWFAGYSGVLVNLSDVAAMGGRAVAVVDALWASGDAQAAAVLAGMRAASERYGVPLVGGHSNLHAQSGQLAVAVLGRAGAQLISSFAAQPGDRLLVAVDLRGQWQDPYPFWNASTEAPAERLRADLDLLPQLAEAGLVDAGKDISMAGVLGSALMLLESSAVGATIDLAVLPRPDHLHGAHAAGDATTQAAWLRWLCAFPSFGFVLSVRPQQVPAVQARFAQRDIVCADVGEVQAGSALVLRQAGELATLWDHAEAPFIGSARRPA
jgi:AIR synthase-related protein